MSQRAASAERARVFLHALRTCELDEFAYGDDTMYETEARLLTDELTRAGLTLEDIGSSRDEIENLIKCKAAASAEFHLKLIRSIVNDQPENEAAMRSDLVRAGLTLEDIGTSDAEMQRLQHQRDIDEAGYYLDRLREGDYSFKVDLALMMEGKKVDPGEIESTAQEIAGLTS